MLRLADAATTFAMELAEPGLVGRDQFGMLDRSTALAELAALAGNRSDLLWLTGRSLDEHSPPGADELLHAAAIWAAFACDD